MRINPDEIKYPRSKYIMGIEWLSERIGYPVPEIKGDTYPMTWGPDNEIYTASGDPLWGGSGDDRLSAYSGLDVEKFIGSPEDYKIIKLNEMIDYVGWGGNGPKPTGMICVDGLLYLAVQNMRRTQTPPFGLGSQHGSDAQIIFSQYNNDKDRGTLWTPSFENINKKEVMFPGYKFGGPSFVNFGKNNENARDDYVYAVSGDQWDNGSNIRLGRVLKDKIMLRECWEWVCAYTHTGDAVWSNKLDDSMPVLSMYKCVGCPEMVYLKSINRYILMTWRLHEDFSYNNGTDLFIFESPEPWGPFSLVYFEEYWEGKTFNPYCPRLPLKWVEPDGVTCWMQYSGSWSPLPEAQEGKYYRSNIRKFKFII